ncbi:1999_t:CDS:2, partial [Scutellospora calospora]
NSMYSKEVAYKESINVWKEIKNKPKHQIENIIENLIINTISTIQDLLSAQNFIAAPLVQNRIIEKTVAPSTLLLNAAVQIKITEAIIKINNEIAECQRTHNTTIDLEVKFKLIEHIESFKQTLHNEIVKYDSSEYPPLLFKYSDLLEQINNSIEFRATDSKRRKETIKVRTINHLHDELEKNYDKHISYTTIYNYLMLCHQNSIAAKKNYHLTNVQDNKAKISLGILAVSKTFKAIQSANELTILPDHDFPISLSGQLLIYIRSQYEIGTSSITHMSDLYSLANNSYFDNSLKIDNKIRPI